MPLSPEAIAEFQSLYSKEYGVVLNVEEAQIKARMLIELFKILRATTAQAGMLGSTGPIVQRAPNTSFESPLSKSLQL